MADVFISYSRRDGEFVRGLAADLEARGKSVWIDTQGIGDGEVFPEAIRAAIEQADAFVFVITPDSAASTYCETEVEYALSLQKRLVPVLRVSVADDALPEAIRVRNWVPFTPDVERDGATARLVAAIDTNLEHARSHTRWLVRALEWDGEGRDRSFLLRGSELAAADGWLAGVGDGVEPAPTALQREFIYASRSASSRRQRMLVVGSAAVAVVSLVLVVFALVSRDQAVRAQSRATSEAVQSKSRVWASESIAQLPIDAERSILIAMAAVRKSPTTDAVFALRRALDVSPLRVRLPGVGSQSNPYYWGSGISYSPDGTHIAEGSQDGSVRIFDAANGHTVRTIAIGSEAPIVQYSPDGSRLAIAGAKEVLLVDPTTGATVLRTSTSAYYAGNLAFSPDGSALYFTNYLTDRPLFVSHLYRWDLRSNRVRTLATGDIGGVGGGIGGGGFFFVQPTPDGRRLVVAGSPGVAEVDARNGRVLASTLNIPFVYWMALSSDGRQIAVTVSPPYPAASGSGFIALLDARTLRRVGTVGPALDGDTYTALAFSPDGTRLAFGTDEGSAGVFDLRSHSQLVRFPGHTTNIYQLTFSPDGQRVATAAGDGRAYIWRAAGNQQQSITTSGLDTAADGFLNSDLAFLGAGLIARFQPAGGSHTRRQVVQQWSSDGTPGPPLPLGPAGNSYVRLSGSGRFVMGGAMVFGIKQLTVRDTQRHRVIAHVHLPGLYGIGCCPTLSNDGRRIAYNGLSSRLKLKDTGTGDTVKLGTSPCGWTYIAFSPADRRVAASDICGHVGVWDTGSGRPVGHMLHFIGYINLGPVQFSPDGRVLAVANSGNVGDVSLVDLATGHTFAVLNGDTKGIQSVAFNPDGSLLATASLDGTARIWDARTGRELRVLDSPAPLDNVAFSDDGRLVATLDYTGVINAWDACSDCQDPQALLALAGKRLTRQLTPAERRTFLG